MAKKESWYSKGKEGAKKSKRVDAEAKARREQRGPFRFWLDYDSSAKITFLDTPSFFLWEHALKLGGSYRNYFTCLKDFDSCPICESGENSSYILVATIISHKKWEDSEGKEHKNQKMLFVAKGRARDKLLRQIERREDDLRFCIYEMARGNTSTEAGTGEDFEFLKRVKKNQLKPIAPKGKDAPDPDEWLEPYDYEKIFGPKTPKELRKIVGGEAPIGSDEEEDTTDKEEKTVKKVKLIDRDDLDEKIDDAENKGAIKDIAEELDEEFGIDCEVKSKDTKGDMVEKIMDAVKAYNKKAKKAAKDADDDNGGGNGDEKEETEAKTIDDLL